MPIKAVLFDLDGTLLPMDLDAFVKRYFGALAAKMAPHGYEPKKLLAAIGDGIDAMIRNDGARSNEKAFWDAFAAHFTKDARADAALFDEFYRQDVVCAKEHCGLNPLAAKTVRTLRETGYTVALATNPIFPPVAT